MNKRLIWLLSSGHLVTDINQGALPAILPFLIASYDLSYTAAASIVFAANVSSSIVQPIFGHAADKFSKPWLLSIGLILAGSGIGMTGLCTNYPLIMMLAIISGIGIAAYHPEAARLVNFAAGHQKNTAMSFFGVGGTVGFTIGPLLITTALLQWGLNGTLLLILPVSIMAIVMTTQFPQLKQLTAIKTDQTKGSGSPPKEENWWAFIRLTVVIIGRSIIFYGLNTFIPIYWIHHLNQSKVMGSLALTIFAGSGILGNLTGGKLADRWGQKKVILSGFLGLTLLLPIFISIDTAPMALFLMIPIGFILYSTYSPSIVMGQNFLPNRVGLSSGITLGLAISIGGAATPVIGRIADLYGIWFAIALVACLPILFFAVTMSLPESTIKKA
ncbi:MFS transporter [Desulfobacula sp.]|uniref:MFS transporter n=1 Tax=Desulfobacula sp. TaxID=2593537 RepID=UPI002608DD10|nr:MFS transporter [Desulfobacula sp.]